jgi:hypothetical protein
MAGLGYSKGLVIALAGILLAVLLMVPARPAQAALGPLSVSGNTLLMGGQPGRVFGVNRSGTEYACIQGWDIFDGPSDAASVQAMASWHVNAVRVPLNEDCWLGINGAPAQYSGSNYINAIVNYVNLLHQYGMYAELSLIWAAPGAYQATYQSGAPDADHSPAMWAGMASVFKNDPNVVLAPWGETIDDWTCFRDGGTCEATYGPKDTPYQTAGMQQAVDVMRQNGYRGVISIPCIDYANDCSDDNGSWLDYAPKDSLNQLVAEAHVYGKNTCDTAACFNNTMGPLLQRVPLLFGETGETYDDSDCGSSYIQTFMSWADAHNVGYQAWTWDTWGTCDSLIGSYSGGAHSGYGTWVQGHYSALAGASPTATGTARTSTPTATPSPSQTPAASGTSTPPPATPTASRTSTAPTRTATAAPTRTSTPTSQVGAAGGSGNLTMYQNSVAPGFNVNAFGYVSQNDCDPSTYISAPCSYAITYTGWGGLSFAPSSGSINPATYGSLDYDVNTNGQPIGDLSILLVDPSGAWINEVRLKNAFVKQSLSGGWVHVSVPLTTLDQRGTPIGAIQLKNYLNRRLKAIHYDDVQLSH